MAERVNWCPARFRLYDPATFLRLAIFVLPALLGLLAAPAFAQTAQAQTTPAQTAPAQTALDEAAPAQTALDEAALDEAASPTNASLTNASPTTVSARAPLADGQIATIGYLEAAPSWRHRLMMMAFERSMGDRGWWERVDLLRDATYTSQGHYERDALWENARLLMLRDDLSIVIAMGTDAAQALRYHDNGHTAVLALDVVNPIEAGLIESDADSGIDNFTLIHMSQGWNDMFNLFHEFVSFRRLGAMFIDAEDGPIASKLRVVARDGGFQLEVFQDLGESADYDDCLRGISELVKRRIDALLVPPIPCFDPQDPRSFDLLTELVKQRVATFAPEGTSLVKNGALFGQSSLASQHIGEMAADMVIKILQGALPRSLPMIFDRVPSIAVNIATAESLGIDLSIELMGVADQVYLTRSTDPEMISAERGEGYTR